MQISQVSSLKSQVSSLKSHFDPVNIERVRKKLSVLLAVLVMSGGVQAEEIYQPCANFPEEKGENCISGTSIDPVTCMPIVTMNCNASNGINIQSSLGDNNFRNFETTQTSLPTVTSAPIAMNNTTHPAGSLATQHITEERDVNGNVVAFDSYELPN